jgi:DNA primase
MDQAAFRRLVDEVHDRTDLAVLIGEDTALASCGSVLKGRSPFNHDEDPSFVVWPHSQTWRDFSGGDSVGGDCFDYVMRRSGGPFMDALRSLAQRAGVELPGGEDPQFAEELARISERRRVEILLTAAAGYYHRVLPSKIREKWFHEHYGFTDETIDELFLGWADGHLFEHLKGLLGATREEALATGLFVRLQGGRVEDFFRDRLVFPYWRHGRVVYFIARATEHTGDEPWEKAKYKKLLTRSERHDYVSPTVANDTLYNEDAARGAEELLITEGVTDCISALQAGVPCVSPVTVRFRKQDQAKLLSLTARAKRIVVCNDSEDSGSGEAGAIETGLALHAAGRDVRIAVIPRPEGVAKIDVNELVARQGPEALQKVIASARRLPEHLIERIPADTPKADLAEKLAPLIDMIRASGPVEREAYLEVLHKRFKLKVATLKALLKAPTAEPLDSTPDENDATAARGEARKGEVFEETDHYYILDHRGSPVVISSFQIEPRQRIRFEDGEIIEADLTTDRGRVFRGLRFPREAWHCKRNLLRQLGPVDLQFTGSDENVQGILRLVASRQVPEKRGTRLLGYVDTPNGPRWVTPDGILGPLGVDASGEDLVYVSSGATLPEFVHYRQPSDPRVEAVAAAQLLPTLLELNAPEVMLPILGWFFAAPLKPRIREALGHFPVLFVWGLPGSGKSTLLQDVIWPLLGVTAQVPYSATETEFALIKLLSATASVPVVLDEYKPSDMPRHRLNTLHRYLRRIYGGEREERGRADQTLVSYRLDAPLCVAGESRPQEAAVIERSLLVRTEKNKLQKTPAFQAALTRAAKVDPRLLSAGIVRFLLGRETAADLALAREVTTRLITGHELPYRTRDNLLVMMLGLHHLEEYAAHLEVTLPELDVETAVAAILEDTLDGGTQVKTGFDYFIEELSVMAIAGTLQHGKHYVYHDGLLALHFPVCHAAYAEHCRRTDYTGEVIDRKGMRRQLVEAKLRGDIVRELDAHVCFNGHGDRRRAVLLDLEQAKKRLAVEDFPLPEPEVERGYRGGWQRD